MSSLYEIISSLQGASGSNAKSAILQANKGNELLKVYLKATYDPALSYYQKKAPTSDRVHIHNTLGQHEINAIVDVLNGRVRTGDAAKAYLKAKMNDLNSEGQELLSLMISRSVGAGVGDTMILKVWPDLYFIPGYMRCSLLDDKTLKHFPEGETFACQEKADGQYCSLYLSGKAYTRAGNAYPAWLVEKLLTGIYQNAKGVLLGEVLVRDEKNGNTLSRQEGNGIVTSALKGAEIEEFSGYTFFMKCWDMLPEEDFKAGKCDKPYSERYKSMADTVEWCMENVVVIDTKFVSSLKEAYAINSKHIADGKEGSVIKTLCHQWKDHTSPYNVKLKVIFEVDLLITAVNEGTGKAKGMMGSVSVQSSDGIIQCDVGTGWNDSQRKQAWEDCATLPGKILALKGNDIISKRGSNIKSIFLPVAIEIREDKLVADSYEHCVAQLNAAKGLK